MEQIQELYSSAVKISKKINFDKITNTFNLLLRNRITKIY